MTTRPTFWHRFWRDSRGRVAVWQWPNRWLWGWLATAILVRLMRGGTIATGLRYAGAGLLLIWAILEFTQGASYFRRVLGAVVLVWIVVSYVHY